MVSHHHLYFNSGAYRLFVLFLSWQDVGGPSIQRYTLVAATAMAPFSPPPTSEKLSTFEVTYDLKSGQPRFSKERKRILYLPANFCSQKRTPARVALPPGQTGSGLKNKVSLGFLPFFNLAQELLSLLASG